MGGWLGLGLLVYLTVLQSRVGAHPFRHPLSVHVWRGWDLNRWPRSGSHDYQACQAGRWVIWLVPSLLNSCQPERSGENKSMAPSSRPDMYLSVIKNEKHPVVAVGWISLIERALHTPEMNKTNCQLVPLKGVFFVRTKSWHQMGSSRFGRSIVYSLPDAVRPLWPVFLVTGW